MSTLRNAGCFFFGLVDENFGLRSVEWTDFFGLIWEGEKGVHAYVGAPDYKWSLYYYDSDDEYDELGYRIFP